MRTPDVSADRLAVDQLVATAGDLAATMARLDRSTHRQHRAIDRWYAGWARQLREHLELIETDVLPTVTARRPMDDDLLETFASGHAWIDEIVGELGDAIGIVAFQLGDLAHWGARAATLADRLVTLLGLEAERQRDLMVELDGAGRHAVAGPDPTGLRSRVERSVRRFRPIPLGEVAARN